MKTLLLCGYRTSDQNEDPLGLAVDGEGFTLIDRRIQQLRALGLEVVCVTAGSAAVAQLSHSKLIESAELVYDTNEPCSLISNTRAGSFVCEKSEPCFVIPLEVPPPTAEAWDFLRNEYGRVGFATPKAFLQAVDAQGAPCHFGFPLLITREGVKALRQHTDLRSLVDTRLKTLHVEYRHEAALEPAAQDL